LSVDWTVVIAAYAAGLATAGNLAGLIRWMLAKSQEKKEAVKGVFKGILGPLRSLAEGMNSDNPYVAMSAFLESFRVYKDEILGMHHDLVELAPEISSELVELITIVDKETSGSWKMQTLGIVENERLKSLAAHLGLDVYDWLSENG